MYQVVDTDISFSESEMKKEVEEYPERFSPNVILRPLYQERILPNLAYVGGPSELVYWLQLKDNFNHFGITFPLLMPRNFGAILDRNILSKIEKAHLSFEDLFKKDLDLVNEKVSESTQYQSGSVRTKRELKELFEKL